MEQVDSEYIREIEQVFPNLSPKGYQLTSPITDRPNCIGWALYDKQQFWDPSMIGVRGYYWPPGIPKDDSLDSWMKVFELHGYLSCENAGLETDVEKIAIYVTADGIPQHVARQKRSGIWVSKLGTGADIEHDSLESLGGDLYGAPIRFMKRPRLPGAE